MKWHFQGEFPKISSRTQWNKMDLLVPINCCPHHHHAEQSQHISGWALIANKPGSGQFLWYLFHNFMPFHSKSREDRCSCNLRRIWISKFGAAQPVNSSVIPVLSEEKNPSIHRVPNGNTEIKNMIQHSFLKHLWFPWSVCWWHFRAMLVIWQWFEFSFLADSQLANK